MIDKSATFFEKFAEDFGLRIKVPRPNKRMRKISAITNKAVGTGLIVAGAVVSSKILIGLGVIGIGGAVMLDHNK